MKILINISNYEYCVSGLKHLNNFAKNKTELSSRSCNDLILSAEPNTGDGLNFKIDKNLDKKKSTLSQVTWKQIYFYIRKLITVGYMYRNNQKTVEWEDDIKAIIRSIECCSNQINNQWNGSVYTAQLLCLMFNGLSMVFKVRT